eukprot:c9985_g1_i1.p1 GENE.c9985_g1_i1~~c9985_g1_i1.p1  ORF type:complete len:614 (-),score=96.15 c9985_g1_i1:356-2197(-)
MRTKSKGMMRSVEDDNKSDFFLDPVPEPSLEAIEARAGQVLDKCSSRLGELVEEWLAEKLEELAQLEESIDQIVDNITMQGTMFSTSLTIVAASCCEQLAEYLCLNQTLLADILNGNGPIHPCLTKLISEEEISLPPPLGANVVPINVVIDWIVDASAEGLPRAREEISALADELSYHPAFFTVMPKGPGQMGLTRAHSRAYVTARVGQVLLDNLVVPLVPKRHAENLMASLAHRFSTLPKGQFFPNTHQRTFPNGVDRAINIHVINERSSSQTTSNPSSDFSRGSNPNSGDGHAIIIDADEHVMHKTAHNQHGVLSPPPRHPAVSPVADSKSTDWKLLPEMSTSRNRCAATAANGKMYVLGGYNGRNCLSSCEAFDPQLHTWTKVTSMPSKRDGCSAAAVDGKVYVIGGYYKQTFLDPIVFDVSTNAWSKLPKMIAKRGDCAATSWDRKVYAIGGFDGKNDLDSVECYDVDTRQWSSLANISVRRSRCAAAAFQSRIFVFGGFDGESFWDTCEVLHLQTGTWSSMPKMSVRRCDCSATALSEGKLLVVGGYNGRNVWDIAEVFDLKTGTWSRLPHTKAKRASAACVAVGNSVLICGGFDQTHCLSSVERLDL